MQESGECFSYRDSLQFLEHLIKAYNPDFKVIQSWFSLESVLMRHSVQNDKCSHYYIRCKHTYVFTYSDVRTVSIALFQFKPFL